MLHLLKDLISCIHLTEDIYHTNNQFDPLEREPWTQKKQLTFYILVFRPTQ